MSASEKFIIKAMNAAYDDKMKHLKKNLPNMPIDEKKFYCMKAAHEAGKLEGRRW